MKRLLPLHSSSSGSSTIFSWLYKLTRSLISISLLIFSVFAGAVEKAKIITIGSPLNSPPYVHESEGRGIEVDLMASIFKKMGYELAWRFLPPKRIRHQVLQREIMAGIRSRPNPGDGLFYSRPYIQFQNVAIAIDPIIQVNSIQDLSKYNVAAFQNAKDVLGPEYAGSVSKSSVYMEMANQTKQIETLFRRRSQVIVLERRIFLHFREMFDPKIEVKMFEIFEPTLYLAVFHDKGLRDEFDKALQATQPSLSRE